MPPGFSGNLIFAIIARMLCGNHLKLSDNKLSNNKLSDNNLASELVENRTFFKPITSEEIVIFMFSKSNWTEWSTIQGVIALVI